MNAENLQNLGLTIGESKVYLALLELGSSTSGDIIRQSKVSSSKIYDILDRLSNKGLVSTYIVKNIKHFTPKSPERLRDYLHVREAEIISQKKEAEKVISNLTTLFTAPIQEDHAEILKGTKGIKTFLETFLDQLDKKHTMYIMGANKESIELMGNYFSEWHQRRVAKNIMCYATYLPDANDRAKIRSKTPLTKTRILPENMKAPAFFVIGADIAGIFIFGGTPLVISIRNQQVADSFEAYFKLTWDKSE